MGWIILTVVVVLILIVLGLAAMKPSIFRVQRQASIQASADVIFHILTDFHRWELWSPWEKLDPHMQKTFSGLPTGPGAVYEWDGNKQVGAGRMEIMDTIAPSKVSMRLEFFRPFKCTNTVDFTLTQASGTTDVVWEMYGPQLFMGKLMSVFINMDKMVGKDFETGLASLKRLAERTT